MATSTLLSSSVSGDVSGANPTHRPALAGIMLALLFTAFLEALDTLIVTPALPHIASSLHGFDHYTWVVTAYLLAATAVIPLAGRLSDQFGRKGFLLSGIGLFLLGSALAGAAQTMDQLVLFRALQGLGSGIGIGLVVTVIGDLYPAEARASKQGMIGIVYGVAQLCGPTLGGWITDHGPLLGSWITETTRWRWLFYLNLPFGVLALLVLGIFLPTQRASHSRQAINWSALRRIDWVGALLIVVATCSLLLGISLGSNLSRGWTSPVAIALLGGSVVVYLLFMIVERRAVEPILPLGLFRNAIFAVDSGLSLVQGMIVVGFFIPLSLFLQGVLILSPTSTGAMITALSVSLSLGAALAGVIIALRKRYQVTTIAGAAIMTLGIFLTLRMTQQTSLFVVGLTLVLVGLGAGSFFAVQILAAQDALPQAQLGVGTGMVRYSTQLGQALGAALMGIVLNKALAGQAAAGLRTTTTARLTLAGTLQNGFWAALVLSLIVLLLTFFLKDAPMTRQTREATEHESQARLSSSR